ncbi:MAG: LPS export ABC transporter periplasmic protein LptC [Bacteroides sp.]|nr:LPS export ABC transporter periplasmic protein LptC [Bacteroides sp.]
MVLAAQDPLKRGGQVRRAAAAVGVVLSMLVTAGCTEETKVNVGSVTASDRIPTMTTRNISTMISDSGVTQYKIVAPLWEVYDQGDNPHWRFPEGLYLRKYDRKLKVIATIAADSATYFKNRNLWRLDGRVEVRKEPDELFLTQQVYWDQNKQLVYSDSFIHIENTTHKIEGYGFHARQDFTEYSIHRPIGIFPAERDKVRSGSTPGAGSAPTPRRGFPAASGAPVVSDTLQTRPSRPGM